MAAARRFRRRAVLLGAASLAAARAAPAATRLGVLQGPFASVFAFLASALPPERSLVLRPAADPAPLLASLARGEIDGAACTNVQGLQAASHGLAAPLIPAFYTLTLPTGLYSRRVRAASRLRDGDRVVLPEDPVENERARVLLYNYGVLRVHEDAGLAPGFANLVNPGKYRLETRPSAHLAAELDRAALVVLPYADAVAAGLRPATDSIGLEDGHSPYAGVLAIRAADRDAPWVVSLGRDFRSRAVRAFLQTRYGDSVQTPW
jgi:D-methionine transport system substrate-binding protein